MAHDAPADMDALRAAIDELDRRIVPLLVERTARVRSAAAFKPTREAVVVPWRIEDVVAKAAAHAQAAGADPAAIALMYRAIVDISIGEEAKAWDALHPGATDGDAVDA